MTSKASLLSIVALILSYFVTYSSAHSQEFLLELPGSSDRASPAQELEILSPDEISDLYKQPSAAVPFATPTPAPELQETKVASPPPVKKDSFTELLKDLEENDVDQSPDRFDINNIWSRQSTMLLPAEVKTFNAAIRRHLKLKNQPIIEVEPPETQEEQVAETEEAIGRYPFIALSSIIYKGANNWATWINGERYTPKQIAVLDGITVEKVTKNKVNLRWKKHQLSADEKQLIELSAIEDVSSLPPEIKKVDDQTFIITLSPNQAFITRDFKIHEGRAATERIKQIRLEEIAFKQARSNRLSTLNDTPQRAPDPVAIQEGKDKEDIAKLLELYRNTQEQTN